AGGMKLYAYVHNDPVNFIDPSGLDQAGMQDIIVTGRINWWQRDLFSRQDIFREPLTFARAPAGNGGGGGTSPQPQNDPVPCDSDLTTTMGSATAVLDGFALGADVVAVGAAGVAVATAPTVVGGISAAGVAAGARAASAVACVLSAGIKLYQGD